MRIFLAPTTSKLTSTKINPNRFFTGYVKTDPEHLYQALLRMMNPVTTKIVYEPSATEFKKYLTKQRVEAIGSSPYPNQTFNALLELTKNQHLSLGMKEKLFDKIIENKSPITDILSEAMKLS